MVANELLNDMALSLSNAEDWVSYNVVRYKFPGGADIRFVTYFPAPVRHASDSLGCADMCLLETNHGQRMIRACTTSSLYQQ